MLQSWFFWWIFIITLQCKVQNFNIKLPNKNERMTKTQRFLWSNHEKPVPAVPNIFQSLNSILKEKCINLRSNQSKVKSVLRLSIDLRMLVTVVLENNPKIILIIVHQIIILKILINCYDIVKNSNMCLSNSRRSSFIKLKYFLLSMTQILKIIK